MTVDRAASPCTQRTTAEQRDNREGTTVVPIGIFRPVWLASFGLWLHISTEEAEQEDSQLLAYLIGEKNGSRKSAATVQSVGAIQSYTKHALTHRTRIHGDLFHNSGGVARFHARLSGFRWDTRNNI